MRNPALRNAQIENWARDVLDRVGSGAPHEDTYVELKSAWWPGLRGESRQDYQDVAYRLARRLAAHANAARHAPVLWLIGVDERAGVVGADSEELADWWPRIEAQFDDDAPAFDSLNITVGGGTVTAHEALIDGPGVLHVAGILYVAAPEESVSRREVEIRGSFLGTNTDVASSDGAVLRPVSLTEGDRQWLRLRPNSTGMVAKWAR